MVKRSPGPEWEAIQEPPPSSPTSEDEIDEDEDLSASLKRKAHAIKPALASKRPKLLVPPSTGGCMNTSEMPPSQGLRKEIPDPGPSQKNADEPSTSADSSLIPRTTTSRLAELLQRPRNAGASAAKTRVVSRKKGKAREAPEDSATSPPTSASPPPTKNKQIPSATKSRKKSAARPPARTQLSVSEPQISQRNAIANPEVIDLISSEDELSMAPVAGTSSILGSRHSISTTAASRANIDHGPPSRLKFDSTRPIPRPRQSLPVPLKAKAHEVIVIDSSDEDPLIPGASTSRPAPSKATGGVASSTLPLPTQPSQTQTSVAINANKGDYSVLATGGGIASWESRLPVKVKRGVVQGSRTPEKLASRAHATEADEDDRMDIDANVNAAVPSLSSSAPTTLESLQSRSTNTPRIHPRLPPMSQSSLPVATPAKISTPAAEKSGPVEAARAPLLLSKEPTPKTPLPRRKSIPVSTTAAVSTQGGPKSTHVTTKPKSAALEAKIEPNSPSRVPVRSLSRIPSGMDISGLKSALDTTAAASTSTPFPTPSKIPLPGRSKASQPTTARLGIPSLSQKLGLLNKNAEGSVSSSSSSQRKKSPFSHLPQHVTAGSSKHEAIDLTGDDSGDEPAVDPVHDSLEAPVASSQYPKSPFDPGKRLDTDTRSNASGSSKSRFGTDELSLTRKSPVSAAVSATETPAPLQRIHLPKKGIVTPPLPSRMANSLPNNPLPSASRVPLPTRNNTNNNVSPTKPPHNVAASSVTPASPLPSAPNRASPLKESNAMTSRLPTPTKPPQIAQTKPAAANDRSSLSSSQSSSSESSPSPPVTQVNLPHRHARKSAYRIPPGKQPILPRSPLGHEDTSFTSNTNPTPSLPASSPIPLPGRSSTGASTQNPRLSPTRTKEDDVSLSIPPRSPSQSDVDIPQMPPTSSTDSGTFDQDTPEDNEPVAEPPVNDEEGDYFLEYIDEPIAEQNEISDGSDSEMFVENLLTSSPIGSRASSPGPTSMQDRLSTELNEPILISDSEPLDRDMSPLANSSDGDNLPQIVNNSSRSASDEPLNYFPDDQSIDTPFESPPPSPTPDDPLRPVPVRTFGGFRSQNWKTYRQDPDNFKPKYYLAKELPHSLQDHINSWSEESRLHPDTVKIMRSSILENTADDEPDAPKIEIINEVDNDPTPPWEFHYTNKMWHGEGVPPPDITGLTNCSCVGKCDPKSKTCACVKRQQQYTSEVIPDFAYDSRGRLKLPDYPIFECNALCGCDDDCQNRVVQLGRKCSISIQKTKEKGWGVFAGPKKIYQGTFIGIYAGELLTDEVGEARGIKYNKFGRTYLFDLDFYFLKQGKPDWETQYVVDAYHAGNFTRFLNHSCDPNCRLVPCYINDSNIDKPLLTVFARKDIEPFEELCFSYSGEYRDDDEEDDEPRASQTNVDRDSVYAKCVCGAKNCSGVMFSC